jgi:hypothetical protein
MSVKLKFLVIVIVTVSATIAGMYTIQHQPNTSVNIVVNGQKQALSIENQSSESVVYPERSDYKTIPLDTVNSLLQGSDPETLALNILRDLKSLEGKPLVEVTYPQPNQALVMITKLPQVKDNSVRGMKYRVEMSRFGRSLLVTSPPVWEIIWVGSQVECSSPTQNQKIESCN